MSSPQPIGVFGTAGTGKTVMLTVLPNLLRQDATAEWALFYGDLATQDYIEENWQRLQSKRWPEQTLQKRELLFILKRYLKIGSQALPIVWENYRIRTFDFQGTQFAKAFNADTALECPAEFFNFFHECAGLIFLLDPAYFFNEVQRSEIGVLISAVTTLINRSSWHKPLKPVAFVFTKADQYRELLSGDLDHIGAQVLADLYQTEIKKGLALYRFFKISSVGSVDYDEDGCPLPPDHIAPEGLLDPLLWLIKHFRRKRRLWKAAVTMLLVALAALGKYGWDYYWETNVFQAEWSTNGTADPQEAITHYQHYLSLYPQGRFVAQARRRLQDFFKQQEKQILHQSALDLAAGQGPQILRRKYEQLLASSTSPAMQEIIRERIAALDDEIFQQYQFPEKHLGQVRDAAALIARCTEFIRQHPENRNVPRVRALIASLQKQLEEQEIQQLQEFAQRNAANYEAIIKKYTTYLQAKRPARVVRFVTKQILHYQAKIEAREFQRICQFEHAHPQEKRQLLKRLEAYLERYPQSPYLSKVRQKIASCQEELEQSLFQQAVACEQKHKQQADHYEEVLKAYQAYLTRYPQGRYVKQAREKVSLYRIMLDERDFARIREAEIRYPEALAQLKARYERYLQTYPQGRHREQARQKVSYFKQLLRPHRYKVTLIAGNFPTRWGNADVYVTVAHKGKIIFTSKTIVDNDYPRWMESFTITWKAFEPITVKVWDRDLISANNLYFSQTRRDSHAILLLSGKIVHGKYWVKFKVDFP